MSLPWRRALGIAEPFGACDCCSICPSSIAPSETSTRLFCMEWGHHATHRTTLTAPHPTETDEVVPLAEVTWAGPSCNRIAVTASTTETSCPHAKCREARRADPDRYVP